MPPNAATVVVPVASCFAAVCVDEGIVEVGIDIEALGDVSEKHCTLVGIRHPDGVVLDALLYRSVVTFWHAR